MKLFKCFVAALIFVPMLLLSPQELAAQKKNKQQVWQEKILGSQWKKEARRLRKDVKKEAKTRRKDGYEVAPGKLPMARQLSRSYQYQFEMDEGGMPKWIIGEATSVGQSKIAAKNQAMEVAKLELAGKLETSIVALVENSLANEQIDPETAASLTKTVTGSKNIISQKIGRVVTLFEAYRPIGNKSVESSVIVAYNLENALTAAQSEIKKELREDAEDIHDKLDKILDLNSDF